MAKTTDEIQNLVYAQLKDMNVDAVIGAFLDYHGWQLIDEGFARHLVDEGLCSPEDVGLDDDDDEDEREEGEDEGV